MKQKHRFARRWLYTLVTALLMLAQPLNMVAEGWTSFITELQLIGGNLQGSARYTAGWTTIEQDLNKGAGGDFIYLRYQTATTEHPASGFITGLKIVTGDDFPDSFTEDGTEWHLVPYTGGDHFKATKGDLNSNAHGKYIHMYYTRTEFVDKRAVCGIYFNSDKTGAVGGDLNEGVGGDYIYMHVNYSTSGSGDFDSPVDHFTMNPGGRGSIHFKLLTSVFDPLRVLHNATYTLKDDNGKEWDIFKIAELNSKSENDRVTSRFNNLMPDETTLFVTNSVKYSPKYYYVSGNETDIECYRDDGKGKTSGNGYAELDWYYPAKFSGKTMRLSVKGTMYYEGGHTEEYVREIGNITFDEVALETYDATIGTDEGEEGMVKIPCVSDHSISWLQGRYIGSDGREHKVDKIGLQDNNYAGFLLLPATDTHKTVTIEAGITTATWSKDKLGELTWPTSNNNIITLQLTDVPMMHNSRQLTAEIDSLGHVNLKWKVSNADYPDILDTDQFLIQRSLTGKEDDFEDIGVEMYEDNQETYSYSDTTLVSSLTPEMIDKELGIPAVRYRVLRGSTLELWGLNVNPSISHVLPQMATLSLLQPTNAKADWSNEEESKVLVTWDYLPNDNAHNYVWDSRAEMSLTIEMRNREGELIGTNTKVLTEEQIAARQVKITLHRSCVNYKLMMNVKSKESPIGQGTGAVYHKISSDSDLSKFRSRLDNGEQNINAILTADVKSVYRLSPEAHYFTGIFNGNGHSLEYTGSTNADNLAPFSVIGGHAVFAYLRLKGTLTSNNKKYSGGITGYVINGSPYFDNCISEAIINPEGTGDATAGGFIGHLNVGSHINISNCLFKGSINLGTRNNSGGLIGWKPSSSMVKLSNSYYGGNGASPSGSYTLVRHQTPMLTFIEDSYYKNAFGEEQGIQANQMADNDCWKNGEPICKQMSFSTPVSSSTTDVQLPASQLYYENSGKLIAGSLSTTALHSSVLLEWATDGGAIDYFVVERRDKAKGEDAWEVVGNQITDTQYEDKTTAPLHTYDYRVKAANNCEGLSYQTTETVVGKCHDYGFLSGYVRFPDGAGVPNLPITFDSNDGTYHKTAYTDESGFFSCDSLLYWGAELSGGYTVAPQLNGYTKYQKVEFGKTAGSNLIDDVVFYVEDNVRFAGFVLYNGTSIPVQGVSFFVDGYEVHSASGKITSDFEGKFSFRMLPGTHVIQARKDGHTFCQQGYYYEGNDTTQQSHNFTIDKAGIYFYDDTRVKLVGRVAGGKDQEAIPLDNSLSRNNLGDDLRMVFTLEGDKGSRLVWDIQDDQLKETDEVFHHKSHDNKDYYTKVHTTINRKVVTPDERTGEYQVWLPPVKWKIEEITAQGYATLFQDGHTNEVIDLTDSLTLHTDKVKGLWRSTSGKDVNEVEVSYHAQYNRIYHAPVNIDYKQLGYDNFQYLGNRYYTAKGLDGTSTKIELVRPVRKPNWPAGHKDSLVADYTFGCPVFNIERSYPIRISATEKYYYNNNQNTDSVDVVRLAGGKVTIQNGFVSSTHREEIELDSVGEYIYELKASQIPYLITGKEARRTVTMTLYMDGTYYEAQPLNAYILNIAAQAGAKDVLSIGRPILVDILRDPPGSTSSAKLSRGSTLTSSFTLDIKMKRGIDIDVKVGTSWDTWQGVAAGVWSKANTAWDTNIDLIWNNNSQLGYSCTMTANSDISTSGDKKTIGADGDVYIGLNTNVIAKPAVAIRAINDSIYQTMLGAEEAGRLLVIAKGTDSKTGKPLYLVRSETMALGQEVQSTFAHSQQYILKQLMPQLEEQCQALMFTGTREEAQRQADATNKAVYLSLRDKDDPDFAVVNTRKKVELGDSAWETFYNDKIFEAQEGVNYVIIEPKAYPNGDLDEVADHYQTMLYWATFIAQNECEKLGASTLMKNFDVDGATGLSYSEEFSTQFNSSTSKTDITTNFRYGTSYEKAMGGLGLFMGTIGTQGNFWLGKLVKVIAKHFGSGNEEGDKTSEMSMTGWKWNLSINPVVSCDFTPKYASTMKFSRKESFTIGMDNKSHLNFDVFYADEVGNSTDKSQWNDVFTNDNYNGLTELAEDDIFSTLSDLKNPNKSSRGFIYRTRGGATQRRWEDQRTTIFYNIGAILDERTKKIENPVIKLDKQSVSGVPFDEPARFKVYLANESEQPEAAYPYFNLTFDDTSNPNGAKVLMDGIPLSGNARTILVPVGQVTEKSIEVYASEHFDYEKLKLRLGSQDDSGVYQDATFDVHFLQTAGAIAISTPGDKWIMNTDAPYDSIRGWYLPVIISGFNRNQHNFDHIEFQYKETTRGDDYWTNLCSFYADSTYYKTASGTKEMIPANGNINTKFYGDEVFMEKGYDIRAVLFCRNGNGYITNASTVLSGVKDTRRPQLFGTPEPKDGILGAGDNIIFNFSEDIEYNYLRSATNFEVKGETNENVIQEDATLLFDGNGFAESAARRNFNDKDVTIEVMIKPTDTGKEMPIFSHGTNGEKLQLWLTADRRLKAVINDRIIEGTTQLSCDAFTRVALALNSEQRLCRLYADDLEAELDSVTYAGIGTIIFGSTNQIDVNKRSFYNGRMLQGRVWSRNMTLTLLNNYGNKQLTGYEMGLTDYYPMNEGNGDYAYDGAQGAHLKLNNASWSLPHTMSLQLNYNTTQDDGMRGLKLKRNFFTRDQDQDYTLMFWFKTDENGRGALISNGSGLATDVEHADRFFIGFEAEALKYRANGQEFILGNNYSDNQWHHYAMTVNKAQEIGNIYIDFKPKASFSTENIGGMSGDNFYLGNMVWNVQGADDDKIHQTNALSGHIDGLTLFEQALPVSLIKRFGNKGLSGEEKGLITYLDFCRQERQKNGELLLVPYVMNKVIKRDQDGNISERNDTVFVLHADSIINYVDRNEGAPVQAYEQLRELNYSFVGSGHQLLVNIDELDSRINKRHIYATVSDIPDKNGNLMASPATVAVYIDRNPLRWETSSMDLGDVSYGQEHYFSVRIYNRSGASHTYTIEGLPKWLTAEVPTDVIGPEEERELWFVINKNINMGAYDHVIYLTDENGLSEPMALSMEVNGDHPEWEPDEDHSQFSMNIVARIQIKDEIVTDERDLVGVFDTDGTCLGVNYVDYDDTRAESLAYLTVYEDSIGSNRPLIFKLWHCLTGKVMVLTPSETVTFKPNGTAGTTKNPIVLRADDQYIQQLELQRGWNWVSLNVISNNFSNGKELLARYNWNDGDMIIDDNNSLAMRYQQSQWITNKGSKGLENYAMSVKNCYRVKISEAKTMEIEGYQIKQPIDRRQTIKQGWNSIGYTPALNLPVATALSDYYSYAEDGDVIKSRSEFAMMTTGANGSKEWRGNLRYLKPGEGYMFYRKNAATATFYYPFYEYSATFIESNAAIAARPELDYANTMSLTAKVEGIELQEGDRLLALNGAEVVGQTLVSGESNEVLYVSISGDERLPLSFAIERGGEMIVATNDVLMYENNAISGTPDTPTTISFVPGEVEQTGWYTVQGIKLPARPHKSGVYIFNGKKQVIK